MSGSVISSRYFWWGLERLLLPGASSRLSVLIFHRVLESRDVFRPGQPDIAEFDRLIGFLAANFTLRPLSAAVDELIAGAAPRHSVAITFDDGYADNVELAMPILERHRAPATFFVSSGFLDEGAMWNDRLIDAIKFCELPSIDLRELGSGVFDIRTLEGKRAAARSAISHTKYCNSSVRRQNVEIVEQAARYTRMERLMMSRNQLLKLASNELADIGGHTSTHPILAAIPEKEARREIVENKRELEDLIGEEIDCFAYPNGLPDVDYTATHVSMIADAGYRIAVSTSNGSCSPTTDILQLPRISPWERNTARFGIRMLLASRNDDVKIATDESESADQCVT